MGVIWSCATSDMEDLDFGPLCEDVICDVPDGLFDDETCSNTIINRSSYSARERLNYSAYFVHADPDQNLQRDPPTHRRKLSFAEENIVHILESVRQDN